MSKSGYVYVLTNDCICVRFKGKWMHPVKVGSTTNVDKRVACLNTAVPLNFRVVMTAYSQDRNHFEDVVHDRLKEHAVKTQLDGTTEFFACDWKWAKKIVREVAAELKKTDTSVNVCVRGSHSGRSSSAMKTLKHELANGKMFECTRRGINAKGHFVGSDLRKFAVCSGARCRMTGTPTFKSRSRYYKQWQRLLSNGIIVRDGESDYGILKEDVIFESPSAAASVIKASESSANNNWFCDGKSINTYL